MLFKELFPLQRADDTVSMQTSGNDKEFDYNFLIICKFSTYLKHQKIIL